MKEKKLGERSVYISPVITRNDIELEHFIASSTKVRAKLGSEASTEEAWVEVDKSGDDGYNIFN